MSFEQNKDSLGTKNSHACCGTNSLVNGSIPSDSTDKSLRPFNIWHLLGAHLKTCRSPLNNVRSSTFQYSSLLSSALPLQLHPAFSNPGSAEEKSRSSPLLSFPPLLSCPPLPLQIQEARRNWATAASLSPPPLRFLLCSQLLLNLEGEKQQQRWTNAGWTSSMARTYWASLGDTRAISAVAPTLQNVGWPSTLRTFRRCIKTGAQLRHPVSGAHKL